MYRSNSVSSHRIDSLICLKIENWLNAIFGDKKTVGVMFHMISVTMVSPNRISLSFCFLSFIFFLLPQSYLWYEKYDFSLIKIV